MQSPQLNQLHLPGLGKVSSSETVLRRIPGNQYDHDNGQIHRKAFANDKGEEPGQRADRHSVSWEKFTTADTLRLLAPNPERFGVAAIAVQVYEDVDQKVEHCPTEEDYGHSNAIGNKSGGTQGTLRDQAIIRITPPPSIPRTRV